MDVVVYVFPIVAAAAFMWLLWMFNKVRIGKRINVIDLVALGTIGAAVLMCLYAVVIRVSLLK